MLLLRIAPRAGRFIDPIAISVREGSTSEQGGPTRYGEARSIELTRKSAVPIPATEKKLVPRKRST